MVPARTELRTPGILSPVVYQRHVLEVGRQAGPPLVDKRRPAWREPGRHNVERVGLEPGREARSGDSQELAVDDGHVIARRETILVRMSVLPHRARPACRPADSADLS